MGNFFTYIYDINLLLIVALGLGLSYYKPSKLKTILFLTLTAGFMLFIYTSRYDIGFDYFNYYRLFNQCKNLSFLDILTFKASIEPGFAIILKLISFFTDDIVIMYLFLGILTFSILMIYIYKYSPVPWISVYLFVTLGFMFGIMNLFRQYFAAIVFLFAIKYIKNKDFLPFMLVAIISASIHKSTLIILPVFFIARLDVNWKTLTLYGSLTLLAYIFCDYVINFITKFVFTAYNLEHGELASFMKGMPWRFVVIPFIYCITAIFMKDKLLNKDPKNIVLINFSIYTLSLWVLMTRHLLIERPSNYLYISSILLGAEVISVLNPDLSLRQKVLDIKKSISKLKKENNKGKLLEMKKYELKKAQEEFLDVRSYYITAIVLVLLLGFFNQIFAMSNGNHRVFPYRSIFTENRNMEVENKIKELSLQDGSNEQ